VVGGQLSDEELDVEFLMREMQRRLITESLPDGETVMCFIFEDLRQYKNWWLVIKNDEVDLCTENPGKDVDLYLTSHLRPMIEVWTGSLSVQSALRKKLLKTSGDRRLSKSLPDWMGINPYADIAPAK
jgi:hypothetical protein